MCQKVLQFDGGYTPDLPKLGIRFCGFRKFAFLRWQFFVSAKHDALLHKGCSLSEKPSEDWKQHCLPDFHLCDQSGLEQMGCLKNEWQQVYGHTKDCFVQEQLAYNHFDSNTSTASAFQFFSYRLNSFEECRSNLTERLQNCLLNSGHRVLVWVSKFLPFRSPLGAV